jgi:hypothetical protein
MVTTWGNSPTKRLISLSVMVRNFFFKFLHQSQSEFHRHKKVLTCLNSTAQSNSMLFICYTIHDKNVVKMFTTHPKRKLKSFTLSLIINDVSMPPPGLYGVPLS